jgi:hypothetical protein
LSILRSIWVFMVLSPTVTKKVVNGVRTFSCAARFAGETHSLKALSV